MSVVLVTIGREGKKNTKWFHRRSILSGTVKPRMRKNGAGCSPFRPSDDEVERNRWADSLEKGNDRKSNSNGLEAIGRTDRWVFSPIRSLLLPF